MRTVFTSCRYPRVRSRIAAAARAAGRDPATVALLAVSKTWPAEDVRALAALGQHEFGENRAQELLDKSRQLDDVHLRWHFVGQLQRNKAAAVARLGAVVHSVDRASLARVLDRMTAKDLGERYPDAATVIRELEDTLALEARLQTELGRTADHREAVEAFLEKRPPSFTGH